MNFYVDSLSRYLIIGESPSGRSIAFPSYSHNPLASRRNGILVLPFLSLLDLGPKDAEDRAPYFFHGSKRVNREMYLPLAANGPGSCFAHTVQHLPRGS